MLTQNEWIYCEVCGKPQQFLLKVRQKIEIPGQIVPTTISIWSLYSSWHVSSAKESPKVRMGIGWLTNWLADEISTWDPHTVFVVQICSLVMRNSQFAHSAAILHALSEKNLDMNLCRFIILFHALKAFDKNRFKIFLCS